MTRLELAQRIKDKHPAYQSMADDELVNKILAKYPVYADQITDNFDTEEFSINQNEVEKVENESKAEEQPLVEEKQPEVEYDYTELIKSKSSQFDRGIFKMAERKAYDKYKETGEIDLGLLPKDLLTQEQYQKDVDKNVTFISEALETFHDVSNVFKNLPIQLRDQVDNFQASSTSLIGKLAGPGAADWMVGDKDIVDQPKKFKDPVTNQLISFEDNPERWKQLNTLNSTGQLVTEDGERIFKKGSRGNIEIYYGDTGVRVGQPANDYFISQIKQVKERSVDLEEVGALTEGFKKLSKGDMDGVSDLFGGGVNAISSLVQTIIPAVITRGASIAPQLISPMITEYNAEKAKNLYPESDDPLQELADNDQVEISTPIALGTLAVGLEYLGFKGISKYILGKSGAMGKGMRLLQTGNKEGTTELTQGGIEQVNKSLAGNKSLSKSIKNGLDFMTSQEGAESYLQGLVGGTAVAGVSRKVRIGLRTDEDGRKIVNESIDKLTELNQQLNQTKSEEVKRVIRKDIEDVENGLKDYINTNNQIAELLTEEQKNKVSNLVDEKGDIRKSYNKILDQFNNNEITAKEFGYTKRSLNNRSKAIDSEISKIKQSVNLASIEKQTKVIEEKQKELGIKVNTFNTAKEFAEVTGQDPNVDGFYNPSTSEIFINKEKAAETGAVNVAAHELLHNIIKNEVSDVSKAKKLVDDFKKVLSKEELEVVQKRIDDNYRFTTDEQGNRIERPESEYIEEYLTAFSDAIGRGDITYKENIFTKIGDVISSALRTIGFKKIKFNTGRDVYNFIKDYQKNITKGKISQQALEVSKTLKDVEGEIKMSKTASENVQKIYEEQGVAGALDIIQEFKPIVNKIVQRRSEAPNFDRQLLTDEIETGRRGLLELIQEYNPESGVPLAAYINKFLPARAIEASKRVLGETFEEDISQRVDIAAPEVEVEVKTKEEKVPRSLRKKLNIEKGSDLYNKVKDAVVKTFGTKLPEVTDPKFKKALSDSYKRELKKEVNALMGTRSDFKMFVTNNAETLYKSIPQETINKRFQAFSEPVLDKDGKQVREKTAVGKGVFKKKPFNKEEFINYFLGEDVGASTKGTRKTALSETIADEMALDATMEVIEDPKVFEKFKEIQEIEGKEVPKDIKPKISEKVKRPEGFKFSITENQINQYKEISSARNIKQALKIANIENQVTVTDSNRAEKQKQMLDFIKKGEIPSFVFEAGKLANFGRKKVDGVYINEPARGSLYYRKTDPNYIEALELAKLNDGKYNVPKFKRVNVLKAFTKEGQEQSKNNMLALKQMTNILSDAVNKKGMPIEIAALYISSGYQATSGIIKIAAPFKYISKTFEYAIVGKTSQKQGKKFREEHNPPASVIGANLILAIKNNQVKDVFPFIEKNYYQTKLSKADNAKLDMAKLDSVLPEGTSIFDNPIKRLAAAGINLNSIENPFTNKNIAEENGYGVSKEFENMPDVIADQNSTILSDQEIDKKVLNKNLNFSKSRDVSRVQNINNIKNSKVVFTEENMTNKNIIDKAINIDKALKIARDPNAPVKKIRVFDFDDTLAKSKSKIFYTKPDGTEGELTAEEFAEKGADLVVEGAVMDFTDFNIVREGKRGPMFDIAKKIEAARGLEDVFVLTARAPESQQAIYEFLKSEGLEIPLKNIVGLGNSTGEAKANWLVNKAAEGYNDFYFTDDAYQNVKAVKDAMSVIDVKSKVQQAKIKFSKSVNEDFNKIIEQTTGIASEKVYSEAKAKVRGANKGNKKFFIPYSAEDFMGLIYPLLSKGKLGDSQMAWFKKNLLDPYAIAQENISTDRLQLMEDFKTLKKALDVPKDLRKKTDSGFTKEQAVRVYLFNKAGYDVPGISKTDLNELLDLVNSDGVLKAFSDQIFNITKGDGYAKPGESWLVGTITTDLIDVLNTVKRAKYLDQSGFTANSDLIFSKENLNKLEAAYGTKYREAMENILGRMKSGKNRLFSGNRLSNRVLDYINNSTGAIMFFNTRSAVLQTISSINFLNWSFNNPIKAGAAFANQKQYWKDFVELINSDYLVDRRNGLKLNINESEIADAAATSKNKAKAAINYILQKGFLPTQYADSFAIASGGATFYRNRINDLVKNQGMSEADAKKQAMLEWRQTSEISQQSSDPSKISSQQASDLGRVILAFANTPMQYARIQKRALQDLINRRGDAKTHVSKIIYYAVVQNLIFNALQSALFKLGFDEEEDEKKEKMYLRTANGMLDSQLRGLGLAGATVAVIKNFLTDIYERSGRKRPEYVDSVYELLRVSPPISSKISKIRQAAYQFDSKKRRQEIFDKGFSIDNPAYEAGAKVISATANIPLDRVYSKVDNISGAMSEDAETWQRIAMLAGWPKWNIMPDKEESSSFNKGNVKIESRKKLEKKLGIKFL